MPGRRSGAGVVRVLWPVACTGLAAPRDYGGSRRGTAVRVAALPAPYLSVLLLTLFALRFVSLSPA